MAKLDNRNSFSGAITPYLIVQRIEAKLASESSYSSLDIAKVRCYLSDALNLKDSYRFYLSVLPEGSRIILGDSLYDTLKKYSSSSASEELTYLKHSVHSEAYGLLKELIFLLTLEA